MARGAKIDAKVVHARILREGLDALLTRGEAAALIASRVKESSNDDRSARNRIGTKMDRAADTGRVAHEGGLARLADGRYTVDEITYWANLCYPGKFDDLPCRSREVLLSLRSSFSATDSLTKEITPSDIEGCRALIEQLRFELKRIQAERVSDEAARKRRLVENFKGK